MTTALVETQWLTEHIDDPDIVIVDGSWHMPAAGRDAYQEFLDQHIPGAVFFDIDEISDKTNPLPHMLPVADQFAGQTAALGIAADSQVIIYDTHGLLSAARVWWTFRVMGHDNVAILNGGLPKWLAENRDVATGTPSLNPAQLSYITLDKAKVRDWLEVLSSLENNSAQVLDARPKTRFDGSAAEPRPELNSGHMPGSLNLHYALLINENGTLKSNQELAGLYDDAGVDLAKPVITSCGSGITAAILSLGLHELGHGDNSLYDGSWTEWASNPESPIEQR